MAFVREVISKEDFEKYQIRRYRERIANSLFAGDDYWAIDKGKNIYLVTASSGGREPETYNLNRFIFFVDGDVYLLSIFVTLKKLTDKYWNQHYKQESWNFIPYFSTNTVPKRKLNEIQELFKEAIKTYRTCYSDDMTDKIDFTFDF